MARTPRLLPLLFALVLALGLTGQARRASAQTAQEIFIQTVAAGAQKGWDDYRVPASVTIAQAILETGWGSSELSSKYHNYFGIKCGTVKSPYQSGCVDMLTTEYRSDGTKYTVVDSFRTYANPDMSMIDHGHFLTANSRYAPAFEFASEPVKFADAMHRAGYATDPNYAHYLYRLMSSYNLFRFDFGKTLGSPTVPSTVVATGDIVHPQRVSVTGVNDTSDAATVDEAPAGTASTPEPSGDDAPPDEPSAEPSVNEWDEPPASTPASSESATSEPTSTAPSPSGTLPSTGA